MIHGMVSMDIIIILYTFRNCFLGTKNVAKCLQKVTQGRVRDKGVTWFPELVDKRTFSNSMCNGVLSVLFREEYKGASLLSYEAM